MSEAEKTKLAELEELLNDPDVPMRASRVWELVDELACDAPHA